MSLKTKVKNELEKINALKQIKDILSNVILGHMRSDYEYAKTIIPILKDILLDTVDSVWKLGKKTFRDLRDQPNLEIEESPIEKNRFYQDLYRDRNSSPALGKAIFNKKKIRIVSPVSADDLSENQAKKFGEVISEFSYPKGPTFSKSIREINKKTSITPGPACYDYEKILIKHRPPKAIFPTVSKRDSYIPVTNSPGPGKYYSSIRCLSKL